MKNKFHGVFSLFLIILSIIVGLLSVPQRCINIWSKNASLAPYQGIKKRSAIFKISPYVQYAFVLENGRSPLADLIYTVLNSNFMQRYGVLNESFVMGLWYIAMIFLSPPIILYSFCAKCIGRLDSCRHVFPGRLSQLLPPRKQGHYTFWDIFWTSVALLALLLFPQYWLWKNITFFIIFWISCFTALTEILLFVCRGCKNKGCPIYIWNGKELF